jgi:hypothetical protein
MLPAQHFIVVHFAAMDSWTGIPTQNTTGVRIGANARQGFFAEFVLLSGLLQTATSSDTFLGRMVALLIIGRAQKPTLRTNPNVT